MKAYKLEVLVIDFDGLGAESVKDAICTARYPNHCISPSVENIQAADIGQWSDEHPLNNSKTCAAEYARLFPTSQSLVAHTDAGGVTQPVAEPDWRAIAEGHALQACYLQEKFDGLLAELEKLPVKGGGYYIRRDAAIALFEHRVSYVSTSDPISAIVDRDTPPDNRDEVVDHDIWGTPITRGMVAAAETILQKDDLPDLLQARQAFLDWNRALAAERKPIVSVGGEYSVFDKVIEFARAAIAAIQQPQDDESGLPG